MLVLFTSSVVKESFWADVDVAAAAAAAVVVVGNVVLALGVSPRKQNVMKVCRKICWSLTIK